MNARFAIIGLGRFGQTLARTLSERGAEVIGIDTQEDIVESMRDEIAHAVRMDATDIKALRGQNIEDMDVVIVAIGNDFESLLLTTVQLQSMNVKRLITRANTLFQKKILEKIGMTEIVAPEIEVGQTLAEKLLMPHILTFIPLPDEYEIVEVVTPKSIIGQPLKDLNLRKKYNLNLITIKRKTKEGEEVKEKIIGVPQPDTVLHENDHILIIGKANDVTKFIEINQ